MSDKKELIIIMPVYNEEGIISNVIYDWIQEMNRIGINYRIHAYNDGSRDESLKILEGIAKENSRLVVHDKLNSGHGQTILLGYCENSDTEWIFQVDSDKELGTDVFKTVWQKRNDYDLLIGHRIGRRSSLSRRVLSLVSRLVIRIFYGKGILDVNIPYRLMRYERFKDDFNAIPKNTFAPNVILSGIACMKKYRIFIFDVPYSNRLSGVTTKKWKLFTGGAHTFFQILRFRFLSRAII